MKIRRFLSLFLLTVLLSALTAVPAYGLEDPAIRAKAALLVDVGSDTILYEKDIHAELDIASTTKIMSALLIFEAIDRGDLRMDQSITATASALKGLPEDGGTAAAARVNINTAGVSELDGLPGIGPVLAQRIVDWRTENGPFRSAEDLLNVEGIGRSTLENLQGCIIMEEME